MNIAGHSIFVSQFEMGAAEEVQAWICEHDAHPFIELHLHQHAAPGEAPGYDELPDGAPENGAAPDGKGPPVPGAPCC